MTVGLISTLIEAPELLALQTVPTESYDLCTAQGINILGNAAGRSELTDLTGQISPPGPIPDGFTARGIVAMFFTVLSALIGMFTIAWYGLQQLEADSTKSSAREGDSAETLSGSTAL